MIEARIKLAKAMGWQRLEDHPTRWFNDGRPSEECRDTERLPDPFTDANDDYAVLEWVRKLNGAHVENFDWVTWDALMKLAKQTYKKGEYSEAACYAMNIPLPSQESDK